MVNSLEGQVDSVGFWGSLPVGRSPAGWLEKQREFGEGPRVLSHYGGFREWGILPHGCSLTS